MDGRRRTPTTRSRPDFNAKLLAEDWPRFEEIATNAQRRVPVLADTGIRRMINGPEAFTPDNEFCLGETEVAGFFVAAGFCAHGIAGAGGIGKVMAEWILAGEPSLDVSHMDVNRFGRQYRSPGYTLARTLENYRTYYDIPFPGRQRESARGLRRSPAYEWHREHGAVFGEKAGWERVDYYEPNAARAADVLRPAGWAARGLVGSDRGRTRGHARARRAVRRDLVRQARGQRGRTPRSSWTWCATTTSHAASATSPTRRR